MNIKAAIKNLSLISAIAMLMIVWAHAASAHKFHESLAQMEYNNQAETVEISLRLFADDLENILSKRARKSVRIGATADFDSLTLDYLRDTFELKNRDGELKKLEWVGKETQVDTVWVYIEVKMPEGLAGATLRNRILFEMFGDQVNRVNIKHDELKTALIFKPGDGFRPIKISSLHVGK